MPAMRADVERVAQSAGATASGVYGAVAFAADISRISGSDLVRIIPIVAVLIALLLAVVLRSLVAPLYLVASIVLSYAGGARSGRHHLRITLATDGVHKESDANQTYERTMLATR